MNPWQGGLDIMIAIGELKKGQKVKGTVGVVSNSVLIIVPICMYS